MKKGVKLLIIAVVVFIISIYVGYAIGNNLLKINSDVLGNNGDCSVNEKCGDGIVDLDEECDDGGVCKNNENIKCTNINSKEKCGEENNCILKSGDGCSDECLKEKCGNNRIDFGEECESGKQCADGEICLSSLNCPTDLSDSECKPRSGDGCSSDCKDEKEGIECNNGVLEAGEFCEGAKNSMLDSCGFIGNFNSICSLDCKRCIPLVELTCKDFSVPIFTPNPDPSIPGTWFPCDPNLPYDCFNKCNDEIGRLQLGEPEQKVCTWVATVDDPKGKCISIICNNDCENCDKFGCDFSSAECSWDPENKKCNPK